MVLHRLPFGLSDDGRDLGHRVLLVGLAGAVLVVGEIEPVLALALSSSTTPSISVRSRLARRIWLSRLVSSMKDRIASAKASLPSKSVSRFGSVD
jgi:hypothetical protein